MDRNNAHKLVIEVAAQSPAKKRKVGAVIFHRINSITSGESLEVVATGYNYNLDGGPCENEDGSTHDNVIHAEAAAIANFNDRCKKDFVDIEDCIMFVTHPPCEGCQAALLKANMKYEVVGDFMKFDSNKPRLALVPPSLALGVAKVMTYGAKKYKVNNWRNTPDIESYISALERHFLAWKAGEENDPESGLHHLEHLACNVAFLIELKHLDKIRKE
jgi:deoxycytidylate deaminase